MVHGSGQSSIRWGKLHNGAKAKRGQGPAVSSEKLGYHQQCLRTKWGVIPVRAQQDHNYELGTLESFCHENLNESWMLLWDINLSAINITSGDFGEV
ncbi:hypothetical protein Y1Q_0021240 [Alligator mississippiensis]|uniref:Uncharacterized protein n=1 Tax=Alligator mississippiensis TaxID=8496 RepID=A0A151MS15_ALLMI|nr:hypothetical protein Y1Q_0021240 [Alligator mississippiensis]